MKKQTRTLVFANLLGLIAVLVVNFLSNSLPLHGKTPAELSDQYPNLFTPAGLTFSIWGVIYLWLLVWVAFQVIALFKQKTAGIVTPMLEKIGWIFAYSCLLNIAWLFAWHWEQLLVSVVIMANLLYILTQLNRAATVGQSKTSKQEKWLEHLPFGIYQGWISIALIANVTAWLVSLGWTGNGASPLYSTIALILAGGLLAVFVLFRQNNIGHGLAVSWAFWGIYLKRTAVGDGATIAWVALGMMVIVLLCCVLRWRKFAQY